MAKAPAGVHFSATIGNLCFYEVGNRTLLRTKSSLTRERVLEDKKFAATRKYAGNLGRASGIASLIYRAWKPGQRFNPDTVPRRSEYFLGERRN